MCKSGRLRRYPVQKTPYMVKINLGQGWLITDPKALETFGVWSNVVILITALLFL